MTFTPSFHAHVTFVKISLKLKKNEYRVESVACRYFVVTSFYENSSGLRSNWNDFNSQLLTTDILFKTEVYSSYFLNTQILMT